jgi:hypothetical protein
MRVPSAGFTSGNVRVPPTNFPSTKFSIDFNCANPAAFYLPLVTSRNLQLNKSGILLRRNSPFLWQHSKVPLCDEVITLSASATPRGFTCLSVSLEVTQVVTRGGGAGYRDTAASQRDADDEAEMYCPALDPCFTIDTNKD